MSKNSFSTIFRFQIKQMLLFLGVQKHPEPTAYASDNLFWE